MNVLFYAQKGHRFDETLSEAFAEGVCVLGDDCVIRPTSSFDPRDPCRDYDVVVCVGVKDQSKAILETHSKPRHWKRTDHRQHAILLDKGYFRLPGGPLGTLYFRASIDAFQPHAYAYRCCRATSRWDALGLTAQKPIDPTTRRRVLFCGSSQKYCDWYGLGDGTAYAKSVMDELAEHTDKEIIYRPKPTWKDARRIEPYEFSTGETPFAEELSRAACVVTHGSNAALEGLLAGVPAIVLGDGIAKPIASEKLSEIERPREVPEVIVRKLAAAIAWCQWTVEEMECGECWRELRRTILEDLS